MNSKTKKMKNFLNEMKIKADKKALEMAKLELSIWSAKHESELINFHGFTPAQVAQRKSQLQSK